MKKFLITTLDGEEPFFTDYFNAENHFNPDIGMTIYNLIAGTYTTDGTTWTEIECDHL